MKESYTFQYKLNYNEAYETFLLLSTKWSRKVRLIITAAVIVIAVVMMILYFMDGTKAHLFFIAILAIALVAYMLYFPPLKARKGAARVAKTGGTYKIVLTADGRIVLPNQESVPLNGDKQSRVLETENVFAIRADRLTTICIPKRVVRKADLDGVREIFRTHVRYQDLREQKEAK